MAYIKPFAERLRMGKLGYDPFPWSKLVSALDDDAKALDEVAARVGGTAAPEPGAPAEAAAWLHSPRKAGPGLTALTISPALASATIWTVEARFAAPVPADAIVNVFWEPFDSEKDWAAVAAARKDDGSYGATIAGGATGALFAVELQTNAGAWRYPDAMNATPYVSVPPGPASP